MKKNLEINKDEELSLLRQKIADLEKKQQELDSRGRREASFAFNEIDQIRRKGKNTANQIQYKETKDYVPVTLYHVNGYNIGKAMPNLHPSNAEDAFHRFARIGITLSIRKPTQEEIDNYKQTDEYKKLEKEFMRLETLANKSRKESEVDKLTQAISKMSGIPLNQMNTIKAPEEVTTRR